MKTYRICVIGGDGIGPDVTAESVRLLQAAGLPFTVLEAEAGYDAFKKYGTPLPDTTLKTARSADAILFGAVTTPPHLENYRSPIVQLRKKLNLFANVRPFRTVSKSSPFPDIDILLFRENTEDLYCGEEERTADRAITRRIITREASERIVRYAYEQALLQRRSKVTIVHKANVMRATDGLFLETAQAVAAEFPELETEDMLVDACAMQLVMKPERFDVIVTTNMFGDILSDEIAGLTGGLGVAASANIGEEHALFEPVHGSAPKYAGTNTANSLASFFSALLMLRYLDERKRAEKLEQAVQYCLSHDIATRDLGGTCTTSEFTDAVITRFLHQT